MLKQKNEDKKLIPLNDGLYVLLNIDSLHDEENCKKAIHIALEMEHFNHVTAFAYKTVELNGQKYAFVWFVQNMKIKGTQEVYYSEPYHFAKACQKHFSQYRKWYLYIPYQNGYLSILNIDGQIIDLKWLSTTEDVLKHKDYLLEKYYTLKPDIEILGLVSNVVSMEALEDELILEKISSEASKKHIKNYLLLIGLVIILPLLTIFISGEDLNNTSTSQIEQTAVIPIYSDAVGFILTLSEKDWQIELNGREGHIQLSKSSLKALDDILVLLKESSYFSNVKVSSIDNQLNGSYSIGIAFSFKEA